MSDNSAIEWTDASWNPIRARLWEIQDDGSGKERIGWHCEHVSEGCRNCYAERINLRLGTGEEYKPGNLRGKPGYYGGGIDRPEVFLDQRTLVVPLHWKKPRKIFVGSMTDVFADFVTDEWLDNIFAVMALCPQHVFQVLTKRAERMRKYLTALDIIERLARAIINHEFGGRDADHSVVQWNIDSETLEAGSEVELRAGEPALLRPWPLPNVWLGVSCERQEEADERIPHLLATPAAVRFISAEPLLGPIKIRPYTLTERPCMVCESEDAGGKSRGSYSHPINCGWRLDGERAGTYRQAEPDGAGIDWIIVGGESGPNARPMHPDWARSLRDQCAAAGVAFFYKQWGEWIPFYDRDREDPDWRRVPHVDNQMGRGAERFHNLAGGIGFHGDRVIAMRRVGKKAAGRLLDGREHNDFPVIDSSVPQRRVLSPCT